MQSKKRSPIAAIVLAVIIGFLVIALLLPMFKMATNF